LGKGSVPHQNEQSPKGEESRNQMKKVVLLVLAMVLLVSTFAIAAPIDIGDTWHIEKNEYTVLVTDVPIETHLLLKMESKLWVFVTVVKHEGNFHWYFTRPIQQWLWGNPDPMKPEPAPTFNLK